MPDILFTLNLCLINVVCYDRRSEFKTAPVFLSLKEEVLAPHPENDDVVNDFDIEEEVIEVENRFEN